MAESEEAGWISMVDLLLLLFAVALLIAAHWSDDLQRTRLSQADGEMRIDELRKATFALESRMGEMILAADEAEARLDSYRLALGDAQGDGSAVRSRLEELDRELAAGAVERAQLAEALKRSKDALTAAEARALTAGEARAAAEATMDTERRLYREATAEVSAKLRDAIDATARSVARVAELEEIIAAERKDRAGAVAEAVKDVQERLDGLRGVMDQEKSFRQALLGIPGSFRNVVFVMDCSSSMGDGGRWDDARRTAAAWITHLPVERAALILFSGGPVFVPRELSSDRLFAPNTRELVLVDDAMRSRMVSELDAMKPHAGTRAFAALRRALEFKDIDAIVLFTDGAPDSPAEVKALIQEWRKTEAGGRARLHTVGVGDYFNAESGRILRELARVGEGVFIGR